MQSNLDSKDGCARPLPEVQEPVLEQGAKKSKGRRMTPVATRFWTKINKTEGCWLWTAATHEFGYGVMGAGSRGTGLLRAHRVSWELHNGPIPAGMSVLHHCDVPACVRPDHLFLGTDKDNHEDMTRKGRASNPPVRRGEDNNQSKLNHDIVRQIRSELAEGVPQRIVAERHGVSKYAVFSVLHGLTWSCVA